MPLPKPKGEESKEDFLSRCMGDKVMVDDYNDEEQRFAICNSLWKQKASANGEPEIRKFTNWEMRKTPDELTLSGYAAVFDQLSEDLGGFQEKIQRGAFAKTIKEGNVKFQVNHEGLALASTSKKTLIVEEDKQGLRVDVHLPMASPDVQSLHYAIQAGGIDQMSFAFNTVQDEWEALDTANPIRTLKEVRLYEVSAVNYPAYPQTSIAVARCIVLQAISAMRKGRVLSGMNEGKLKEAVDAINSATASIAEVLAQVNTEEDSIVVPGVDSHKTVINNVAPANPVNLIEDAKRRLRLISQL